MFPNLSLSNYSEQHSLSLEDCWNNSVVTIRGTEGVITGFIRHDDNTALDSVCHILLMVPDERRLVLIADILGGREFCHVYYTVCITPGRYMMKDEIKKSPVLFIRTNTVNIQITEYLEQKSDEISTFPKYQIIYTSTTQKWWTKMIPIRTSLKSGFIQSPGFDLTRPHDLSLNASYTLTIPKGLDAMVSFSYFKILTWEGYFQSQRICRNGRRLLYTYDNFPNVSPEEGHPEKFVIHFSQVQNISTDLNEHIYLQKRREHGSGFNMSFSFHDFGNVPQKVRNRLFNCSVMDYPSFQNHLHCNLRQECDAGEDEGEHCPFSSSLCQGMADAWGKCFFPVHSTSPVTWSDARAECQRRGGDLAMMKTDREWTAFWNVYDRIPDYAYIGLYRDLSVSYYIYVRAWFWIDETVAFDVNMTRVTIDPQQSHLLVGVMSGRLLHAFPREKATCSHVICQTAETKAEVDRTSSRFLKLNKNATVNMPKGLQLIRCPRHEFVRLIAAFCPIKLENSSYRDAFEKNENYVILMSTQPSLSNNIFSDCVCDDGRTMPYSLLCDFIRDCSDGSDEAFCTVAVCSQGMCRCNNGQCISISNANDFKQDCFDKSDVLFFEINQKWDHLRIGLSCVSLFCQITALSSELNFMEDGIYVHTSITFDQPCPDTHFRCPHSTHCLPVYLLCHGVKDCLNHEDEMLCDVFNCSGFHRCRRTQMCVHVSHLCDGIAQCPWHDDEMWCDVECPQHCQCQGLSFVCRQPFPAVSFPQLRYLDGSQSMMTVDDFVVNSFLVYLKLSLCKIDRLHTVDLPNLKHLDISWNEITSLDMDIFLSFKQLKTLSLNSNPLNHLKCGVKNVHTNLDSIEISHTQLSLLSGDVFKHFMSLKSLNLSSNRLTTIAEGFQSLSSLKELDLRGNAIKNYPLSIFKNMRVIRLIYADDYKLCCSQILPDRFDIICKAPKDELSSCEDLLVLDVYRAFVWFIAMASLLGNVGCFCFRNFILKNQSASVFNTFVSNLSVACCLMGIYLIIIGVADNMYRGMYYLYETTWLSSTSCNVSGLLCLLSSEVSALTIWFITLDRFLVLRFPFSVRRFIRNLAVISCVVMWTVGFSLSLTPFLLPHWNFYSQTGMCITLPITKQDFGGHEYSFGVMVVFNFILLLFIGGGQACIYQSVRSNTLSVGTSKKEKDVTIARRLITVAMSDFLCWFPIGLLSFLSAAGIPVQTEVNVSMSVFVLPLNSALNPFLYTFNMLAERRRKRNVAKIMKYLETTAKLSSPPTEASLFHLPQNKPDSVHDTSETKQDIAQGLHAALNSKLISLDHVKAFLFSFQNKMTSSSTR